MERILALWFILLLSLSTFGQQQEDFIILDDPIYFIEDETWDDYEGPVYWCPYWFWYEWCEEGDEW